MTLPFEMTIIKRERDEESPNYGRDLFRIPVLSDDENTTGVCLLKGFSGFWHAPRTHVKEAWAYQEGVTLSDFPRVEERIMDLRLATKGHTAAEWERNDSRLWDILNFREDCVIRIKTASATREINCRLERKPVDQMDLIPGQVKHMVWAVTLIACDPWWYSSTLSSSWTRGSTPVQPDGWYNGSVTVLNRGDEECWLEWSNNTIQVAEQWSLPDAKAVYPDGDLAGQQVMHILPQLGVGKEFLVQTHPLRETLMVMDNSLEWAKMKAEEFVSPMKRHDADPVTLPVRLKGGNAQSTITVFMVQRWDRPVGGERFVYEVLPEPPLTGLYPSPTTYPGLDTYAQTQGS